MNTLSFVAGGVGRLIRRPLQKALVTAPLPGPDPRAPIALHFFYWLPPATTLSLFFPAIYDSILQMNTVLSFTAAIVLPVEGN
jgi:hypothetical protein